MNKTKEGKEKGITLVSLIVTVIILLILSVITILQLTGNGLFSKTQKAVNETNKQTATEKMNLKITNLQMASYIEKQEMPTLQYLADGLCEDNEIEYVLTKSKMTGSLDKIDVGESKSIFTKIKEYPYEFEINGSLQLASINGVKVAESNTSYDELKTTIDDMKVIIANLQKNDNEKQQTINEMKSSNEELKNRVKVLEDETIVNKRINLMSTPVTFSMPVDFVGVSKDITLSDSIENYKYLEIQCDIEYADTSSGLQRGLESTNFIAVNQLKYYNGNDIGKQNENTFVIEIDFSGYTDTYTSLIAWFKNNKTLHIGATWNGRADWNSMRIRNIYGIK